MKKSILRILTFAMALTLILVPLTACSGSSNSSSTAAPSASGSSDAASGETYKLRFSHSVGTTDPTHIAAEWMATELKARSNGRVTMEIYPSAQIGDQIASTEMMMDGTLDFFAGSVVAITNWINAFKIVDLPYLVYDYESADKLFGGEIGQELSDMLPSIGLYNMGWCEYGFRNIYNNKRPIEKAADFKGIKVRSIESSISIDTWSAFGADPTVMGWSEVYTGLQQGTVDGADGPATLFQPARMEEVVSYMSTTQHMYTPGVILGSKASLDKLPEDVRELVFEVGAQAAAKMKEMTRATDKEAVQAMQTNGLKVNEVSNEVRAELAELCAGVYKNNRDVIGAEFFDKTMQTLGRDPSLYQ